VLKKQAGNYCFLTPVLKNYFEKHIGNHSENHGHMKMSTAMNNSSDLHLATHNIAALRPLSDSQL
jgi:hypothetical protein